MMAIKPDSLAAKIQQHKEKLEGDILDAICKFQSETGIVELNLDLMQHTALDPNGYLYAIEQQINVGFAL